MRNAGFHIRLAQDSTIKTVLQFGCNMVSGSNLKAEGTTSHCLNSARERLTVDTTAILPDASLQLTLWSNAEIFQITAILRFGNILPKSEVWTHT